MYKLVAVRNDHAWLPVLKLSESPQKTPTPGPKQLWRIYDTRGKATADVLSLDDEDLRHLDRLALRHPFEHTKYRSLDRTDISTIEPLLVSILDRGRLVYTFPSIEALRIQRQADVARLDVGVRRLINPHTYHVSLTQHLWDLKQHLIQLAQGQQQDV